MSCYFAVVEVFDPTGPNHAEDGAVYGGETRFFVLQADDLGAALEVLNASIAEHGLALMCVLHAGGAEQFDDDMLPFEVDIDAMVETAERGGEICVSEAHAFEPDPAEPAPSGVFAACLDLFDPEWADEDEGTYAGHYQLVVLTAPSAAEAMASVLAECAAQEVNLQGIEGLVDAGAFPFDAYEFEFDDDDPVGEAQDTGGLIWSNGYSYPPDAPRRLDS